MPPLWQRLLNALECPLCGFRTRMSDGIFHALSPDRAAHYARFIQDYERIRAAEGRGSKDDEFYLGLPYADSTGRTRTNGAFAPAASIVFSIECSRRIPS